MSFIPKTSFLNTSSSKIAKSVIFDASAQTLNIVDNDFKEILYATNVTDGIVIFDPANPSKTGTRIMNRVDLVFDTSSMANSNDILVIYEPLDNIVDFGTKTTEKVLTNILECLKEIKMQMAYITGFGTETDN